MIFDCANGTNYARGGSKGAELKAEGMMREFGATTAQEIAGASMPAMLGIIESGIRIVKP